MRQDSYRFRPLGPGHGEGTGAVTGVAQLTRTRKASRGTAASHMSAEI